MPSITIRNVPEAVHRALRVRAARHGRSTEAEIRDILEQAATPAGRRTLGALLTGIARDAGGLTETEADQFDQLRDRAPTEPPRFA